jgi:pseudaminic acid biosynthesis-associated methylase
MDLFTEQMLVWKSKFGRDYTDRNGLTVQEMDALYEVNYGVTRTTLNERFLKGIERSARILEVGTNIGLQLQCLQRMGFSNLFGIELQAYALEESKRRARKILMIQGSAFYLPFKDAFFDLVFTSGVLIHIHPSDLMQVLREIRRCSRRWIWGFEYFSERCQKVSYRGQTDMLWKNNFAREYLKTCLDLGLLREEHFKYRQNENMDSMFLLGLNHNQEKEASVPDGRCM